MKGRTLTRADLCEAVHEEVGLTRQDCASLVERTLDLVVEALERGATVKLSGFGVFQVRAKRERIGRDRSPPGDRLSRLAGDEGASGSRPQQVGGTLAKGPEAFRSISEAADALGVPQHVLRFWETKFSFIRPMKRAGGRRFYRPLDIAVLAEVRRLLHEEGYTIKGVQRLHREQGSARLLAA